MRNSNRVHDFTASNSNDTKKKPNALCECHDSNDIHTEQNERREKQKNKLKCALLCCTHNKIRKWAVCNSVLGEMSCSHCCCKWTNSEYAEFNPDTLWWRLLFSFFFCISSIHKHLSTARRRNRKKNWLRHFRTLLIMSYNWLWIPISLNHIVQIESAVCVAFFVCLLINKPVIRINSE